VKNQMQRDQASPAIHSWMILDRQYLDRYLLGAGFMTPQRKKLWLSSGFMKQGSSIAELARALDIDERRLTATVDRFNDFVAAGDDRDFGRGERAFDRYIGDMLSPLGSLGSIEKAPFYAVPILPGDIGTFGGIVTDEYARALR